MVAKKSATVKGDIVGNIMANMDSIMADKSPDITILGKPAGVEKSKEALTNAKQTGVKPRYLATGSGIVPNLMQGHTKWKKPHL